MNTILVGIDGSGPSRAAAKLAQDLAVAMNCELELAHSIPFTLTDPLLAPLVPHAMRNAQLMLHREAARISAFSPDRPCRTTLLSGKPAEALAGLAASPDVQMVVVGSRGEGAASRVLLGSTSDALAQTCPKPVLVVKEAAPPPGGVRFIVVGVDGSPESHEAARVAGEMAEATGASLRIACAAPVGDENATAFAASVVREAAARQSRRMRIERVVLHGRAAEALAEAALDPLVAMIVVGHRGRNKVERMLLGSVTDRLVQIATVPVLIVR
jgi:nucleotide-binding universal stress UspA family protein